MLTSLAIGPILSAAPAQADPSVADIQKKIDKSSAELEGVVESYNKVNEELKATRAAAATLTAKMKPLEQQVATTGAEVAKIASSAYKAGQVSAANALLSGANSGNFVDRLAMLDNIARERQGKVKTFTDTATRYRSEKQKLDTTQAKQAAQVKELDARKKKIKVDLDKLYDLRRQAYGRATVATPAGGGGYSGKIPSVAGSAGTAVSFAYGAIGKPYVWGAEGPGGYDCSGLTLAAWRAAGRSLPHNAAMQWNSVTHISRAQLQPGDLVFYNGLAHVGIFVGGGQIIHAPTFGENVKLAGVDVMSPYGYGRVG